MSFIFGLVIIGALALMAGVEIRRYGQAIHTPDEFPYPRRRLTRRIAIALIFSVVVGIMLFLGHPKVKATPGMPMVLFFVMCLGVLIGFILLWRDLRETSLEAVEQASRLSEQAGAELRRALRDRTAPRPDPEPEPGSKPDPGVNP